MFFTKATVQTLSASRTQMVLPLLTVAALYVAGVRILAGADLPLWLDETWSAMIAAQPTWAGFWREAWLDCNPPLYYLFLTAWVTIFGDSNFVLRLPSALFMISAAAAPLLWRDREESSAVAWTWSLLLLAWSPGLFLMSDARGYGLIFLLSVLSCLVMRRLLAKLSISWAVAWVALNTLMFLTHYYAAVLSLGQAAIVVYRHRSHLLGVWPAGLAAIPGVAWFVFHYPRLQDYARPDVIWYEPLDFGGVIGLFSHVFGAGELLTLLVLAMFGIALIRHHSSNQNAGDRGHTWASDMLLVSLAGAVGFILAMLVGAIQPSLTGRYLVPLAPPAMLALALGLRSLPRPELMTAALILAMLMPGFDKAEAVRELSPRSTYGFEKGSNFIAKYQPDHLVFVWDHPAAKILDGGSLRSLGSLFLNRAGQQPETEAIILPRSGDGNLVLEDAVKGERPAIIWLYDTGRRSAAKVHPPAFENDAAWSCHHTTLSQRRKAIWGDEAGKIQSSRLGAIACIRTGS